MARKTYICKYCETKTSNSGSVCCNCNEKLRLIRKIKKILGGSDGKPKKGV